MMDDKFYVYIHTKADTDEIFYVGKGYGKRHLSLSGRNRHWKNTAKKHGWNSEIITPLLSEIDAFYVERMLIDIYRRSGIGLCNIADGGEGAAGLKHTEETKEKFRKAKIGKKQSPDHAAKSASAKIGKKQTNNAILSTMIVRSKSIINSDGMVFYSVSDAARFLSIKMGKKVSQGSISLCAAGRRSQAYGYTWSYDVSKTPELKNINDGKKIILNITNGMVFPSVRDAVKFIKSTGVDANHQCISSCARGELKTAYGYEWGYL